MSLTSRRLKLKTEKLIREYILDGMLPDELVIEESLKGLLNDYYDTQTGTYSVDSPLWEANPIVYRGASNYNQWNTTQEAASEDMTVAHGCLLDGSSKMADKLYEFITRANLIRARLARINNRIDNLNLSADDVDGFVYSFSDTFTDTNYVSFTSPHQTTALVNVEKELVELPRDPDTEVPGQSWVDSIVNLTFLQDSPRDISFSVINPVESIVGISSGSLTDIFNNQAIAWQKNITIRGVGPLEAELAVRISPLEPIEINRIEIQTKMNNYANQLMIQVMYSPDGISYVDLPCKGNPQCVGKAAVFNSTSVWATHVKFLITKNAADQGRTYDIGFQYINFIHTQYLSEADFYSEAIAFPDGRIISKVACDVCESIPDDTDINYFIMRGQMEIPISPISDNKPEHAKIIDLGALKSASIDVPASGQWTPSTSGTQYIDLDGLSYLDNPDPADSTLSQTLLIHRNIGDLVTDEPSGVRGFEVNPSGFTGHFSTYVSVGNPDGATIDLGADEAIVDGKVSEGPIRLNAGTHRIITSHLDKHQGLISEAGDYYYAFNMGHESLFDFTNNFEQTDMSRFAYSPSNGYLTTRIIPSGFVDIMVDNALTFVASEDTSEAYKSSTTELTGVTVTASNPINAGDCILATLATASWVNRLRVQLTGPSNLAIRLLSSIDGATYTEILRETVNQSAAVTQVKMEKAINLDIPVFAKYIKVEFILGTNIVMTSDTLKLFEPLFVQDGLIITQAFYLPTGTDWSSISDAYALNPLQSYVLYSAFDDTYIGAVAGDLSAITGPKMYAKIYSNTSAIQPYVAGVQFCSLPYTDEASRIMFDYLGHGSVGADESYREVRLKATLSSTNGAVTPELQSYRIKLK